MKHIKLFEGFNSSNPVITATGDWSKLTTDETVLDFIHPDTLIVTYHTNPTQEMVKSASMYGTIGPDESVDEIMGGDQNGGNLTQRGGMVEFVADSSYSPEDYKKELQKTVDQFNANPEGFDGRKSTIELQRNKNFSDATLTVLNALNNPVLRIEYKNCFPVSMSDIKLDTKSSADQIITCTSTFRYESYKYLTL